MDGFLFDEYVTTYRRDRYNLMCLIDAHKIYYKSIKYKAGSGGVIPLP